MRAAWTSTLDLLHGAGQRVADEPDADEID